MEPAIRGWRHWYHVTFNPYGQWLRGDPRGWRERRHREHVEGDYKNPPPPSKLNEALYKQSKKRMKHEPVTFAPEQRRNVGIWILESLGIQQRSVLVLAVGEKHVHTLVQCPDKNPKRVIGKAKNHVWGMFFPVEERRKEADERPALWAAGSDATPIEDESHARWAVPYILEHRDEGAWVWCFRCARDGSVVCVHRT
jgi:hypothetical protein